MEIEKYYVADGPTQIPARILPDIQIRDAKFTQKGIVSFSNLKLGYGPSGKIYFRGKTMTILSTAQNIDKSSDMTED